MNVSFWSVLEFFGQRKHKILYSLPCNTKNCGEDLAEWFKRLTANEMLQLRETETYWTAKN
jgi:hypothetical protein